MLLGSTSYQSQLVEITLDLELVVAASGQALLGTTCS